MLTAIVGINWGDEGKGRMVDLLTENYDIVIRYQGGGNAGHTVINEHGKFALHLLPSGIFREGVVNILGNGVAVDPENLWQEMQDVAQKGVPVTPDNLKISDRASLLRRRRMRILRWTVTTKTSIPSASSTARIFPPVWCFGASG